ncbi:MAG: SRPBCC family protein [Ornithinimicrobium sp.]
MSEEARVSTTASPAHVWGVLADISAWPSWSASVVSVVPESSDPEVDPDGEHSAYRIEQPPLPHALWTITDWRAERGFTWQTRGASSVMSVTYALRARQAGTEVWVDLTWSGAMAWMARAAYGPVSVRYADAHLRALVRRCESPA